MKIFQRLLEADLKFQRIRCHGKFGLHSLLFTGNDYLLYDFQGNVGQSVGERRLKRPALRDVAGMLWSLDSAVRTVLADEERGEQQPAAMTDWGERWFRSSAAAFLDGYLSRAGDAPYLPARHEECRTLLTAELFRVALGELNSELDRTGQISPATIAAIDRLLRTT
jgi:maltose alpha-D-glucosyltransferase/alpha-amylase